MTSLLVLLCLLLSSASFAIPGYDSIIHPVRIDMLQDTIITREVQSVIKGNTDDALYAYKGMVWGYSYRNSWGLGISVTGEWRKTANKNKAEVDCSSNHDLLNVMTYSHVKYQVQFTRYAFQEMNAEIAAACTGGSATVETHAYISKDRYRHYLYMSIQSGTKHLTYVLRNNHPQQVEEDRKNKKGAA